jgi:disulfide bond formation protein DsbB
MMTTSRKIYFDNAVLSALLLGIALCAALVAQYGFKFEPCELCLQQRQPYAIGIPLAFIVAHLATKDVSENVVKAAQALFVAVIGWSLFLSLRHSGVEWGFWAAPGDCTASAQAMTDINDLQAQLKNYVLVPCDRPAWKLFGLLSLANLNALLSAFLFVLNALVLAGYDPRRLYGSRTVSQ